jgi:hypothetical protein
MAEPVKHWKIAPDDIRNYALRTGYIAAIDEMFARTSTRHAPWRAIAGEHKWFARVAAIRATVAVLSKGLKLEPIPVDPAVRETAVQLLTKRELIALGVKPRR